MPCEWADGALTEASACIERNPTRLPRARRQRRRESVRWRTSVEQTRRRGWKRKEEEDSLQESERMYFKIGVCVQPGKEEQTRPEQVSFEVVLPRLRVKSKDFFLWLESRDKRRSESRRKKKTKRKNARQDARATFVGFFTSLPSAAPLLV